MPYTPTGRPVGRPKTKDYKTISLKIPQDLLDRVQRYAGLHRQSISELIRDGLEWRITEGDPHGRSMQEHMYYGNTELQELAKPLHMVDDDIPFDDDIPPTGGAVARAYYNGNTVLQDITATEAASALPDSEPVRRATLAEPIPVEADIKQQIRGLRQQAPYRDMKYREFSETLYNMGIRTRKGTAINAGTLLRWLNETPVKKA